MSKITKTIYIHKFKKTKLYKNKKIKKQTLYNLNGGDIKVTRQLFFTNFDKIKEFLKIEIDELDIKSIKKNTQKIVNVSNNETKKVLNNTNNASHNNNNAFNNNLNILNEVVRKNTKVNDKKVNKTFKNTSHINTLFNNIIKKLIEKTIFYFNNEKQLNNYITYKFIEKKPVLKFNNIDVPKLRQFLDTIITDTINWIINCFINCNFSIDGENLLFKNYDIFLDLYSKLILLTENYDYLKYQVKKDIKGIEAYKQTLIKKRIALLNLYNNNKEMRNRIDNEKKELMLETYNATKEKELNDFLMKIKIIRESENSLETFNSLDEFNQFIKKYNYIEKKYNNYIYLIQVNLNNEIMKKNGSGEENVDIILNTPKLYLYKVKTHSGAMYYGSGTKWCVSQKSQNSQKQFDDHIAINDIYIIQEKDNITDNITDNNTNKNTNPYILQKSKNKYMIEFNKETKEFKDAASCNDMSGTSPEDIIKNFNNNNELVDFFKSFKKSI